MDVKKVNKTGKIVEAKIHYNFSHPVGGVEAKAYLFGKIKDIEELGDNWDNEGTPGPNNYILNQSRSLIDKLIINKFFPYRIVPTVEEGICFVFKKDDLILYLELYNDKEIGYIIEDVKKKKIVENKSLKNIPEIISTLTRFHGNFVPV